MFITFEGPEGSGKTTQIALLAESLQASGVRVLTTREPGGVPVAEDIRNLVLHGELYPQTEVLLFLAARAEHTQAVILPALMRNTIVLCDRFNDSTIAYQGYGLGLNIDTLSGLCSFASCGLRPDLTLLLDLKPEIGLRRRFHQDALTFSKPSKQLRLEMELPSSANPRNTVNKMEDRTLDFHYRVWSGFRELREQDPERIKRIKANQSIEKVHRSIMTHVTRAMKRVNGRKSASSR